MHAWYSTIAHDRAKIDRDPLYVVNIDGKEQFATSVCDNKDFEREGDDNRYLGEFDYGKAYAVFPELVPVNPPPGYVHVMRFEANKRRFDKLLQRLQKESSENFGLGTHPISDRDVRILGEAVVLLQDVERKVAR